MFDHAKKLSAAQGAQRLAPIPFVGRSKEIGVALNHLKIGSSSAESCLLVIRGDSGTGKSFFMREVFWRCVQTDPKIVALYVDVANDEYESSRVLTRIYSLTLLATRAVPTFPIQIHEDLTFATFRRKPVRAAAFGGGLIRTLASAAGNFLGLGGALGSAFGEIGSTPSGVKEELQQYLLWAAKSTPLLVGIDNVQFLNSVDRSSIESLLQGISSNLRVVMIDRTVDGNSELTVPVRLFPVNREVIELGRFDRKVTRKIVQAGLGGGANLDALSEDIFIKTGGIAKDIEYCLRQFALESGGTASEWSVEGLLATIDRLPLIQQQFLTVAAMLDGGLKREHVFSAVRRLAGIHDDVFLKTTLDDLVAREYLKINGENNDRVRSGHERVVHAMRDLVDDELQEEVRRSLVGALAEAIDKDPEGIEPYLLHCLVGLQSAQELARNLHYISRLVRAQHRNEQFGYLVTIAHELNDILAMLPQEVIATLLDAHQKASAFDRGLELIHRLERENAPGATDRMMFRFKFLIQLYRYDDAESVAVSLPEDESKHLYMLNVYLALVRPEEARAVVKQYLDRPPQREAEAVLLRNSATLLDPVLANRQLSLAAEYFRARRQEFGLATVECNLGLLYLVSGRIGDAGKVLERSMKRFRNMGSREVYQPLVNLGVRAAQLGQFGVADALHEDALLKVPQVLQLDRLKIEHNRILLAVLAGDRTARDTSVKLGKVESRIRGIRMPYLLSTLNYNRALLDGTAQVHDASAMHDSGLTVPIEVGEGVRGLRFLLSVHWRH